MLVRNASVTDLYILSQPMEDTSLPLQKFYWHFGIKSNCDMSGLLCNHGHEDWNTRDTVIYMHIHTCVIPSFRITMIKWLGINWLWGLSEQRKVSCLKKKTSTVCGGKDSILFLRFTVHSTGIQGKKKHPNIIKSENMQARWAEWHGHISTSPS